MFAWTNFLSVQPSFFQCIYAQNIFSINSLICEIHICGYIWIRADVYDGLILNIRADYICYRYISDVFGKQNNILLTTARKKSPRTSVPGKKSRLKKCPENLPREVEQLIAPDSTHTTPSTPKDAHRLPHDPIYTKLWITRVRGPFFWKPFIQEPLF